VSKPRSRGSPDSSIASPIIKQDPGRTHRLERCDFVDVAHGFGTEGVAVDHRGMETMREAEELERADARR